MKDCRDWHFRVRNGVRKSGFLTGIKRPDLCRKLAGTIRRINPEICMEGHWVPAETEDTLADLMSDMG